MITYLLIAITVAASFYAWSKPVLFSKLMMNPYRIYRDNEYYRLITSGFIHKDHMHLLFNMFSFYFFGLAIEEIFSTVFGPIGNIYYLLLYLMAIVVSDLPTFWKNKNDPRYNSLGASGGVSAVVLAFIIFNPLAEICIYIAICLPGFIMGVLYIAFSYYQGRKSNTSINHDAHLYGALFGFVFCAIMHPSSLPNFATQVEYQIRQWLSF